MPTPGSPINTGLFFCRRERICITRSISVWRDRVDALGRLLRQVAAELVEQLRALLDGAPPPSLPPAGPEHADDLVADLFRVGVEVEQDGHALVLADEPEQDVLVPM